MEKLTWDSFTKKIHINAPIKKIYWCWATQEGISSWFLKEATYKRGKEEIAPTEYLKEGDTYSWMWHNWDGKEIGKIIKANDTNLLRFSFAGEGIVTIILEQKENTVLVSLTQTNIPLDEKSKFEIFYGCSNGWTFWLTNLKAYLEHGILLNETEIDLRGFDSSGYKFVNM